ncbi:uncharacterized protein Dyak_GE28044 [Drosophila yakuba]|uniref:Uncharacterized protein n=1 Tax=Drosophila yakuba TaxID=7245 RepID=A0A0R1EDD7_DROYA|nr:uncharacterized protein Dyak_GE28044 [Drosophila yakuba]
MFSRFRRKTNLWQDHDEPRLQELDRAQERADKASAELRRTQAELRVTQGETEKRFVSKPLPSNQSIKQVFSNATNRN